MGEMDEVITEFLIESQENLGQVERDLVDMESASNQEEALANVFRAIHSIKGTCSFLGFRKLESLAHTGETLLSLLRDGAISLAPKITSTLLSMVDAIRQMLSSIERAGNDGEHEYSELIQQLTALQNGTPPVSAEATPLASQRKGDQIGEHQQPTRSVEGGAGDEGGKAVALAALPPGASTQDPGSNQDSGHKDILADTEVLASTGTNLAETQKGAGDGRGQGVADSTIRVDVKLLDKLMTMVGELVLTRNQIVQSSTIQQDAALVASTQRLSLITSEVQEGIMKTRMQPIGNIFSKFPRVVRDLALSCGKEVRVEMVGKDTELDKTLIEAIKDPLTHLVRNSVDHGIETPDIREERGT